MTLRPPTVLTRTVRYAHDGGRLLEHLAAAGLIATTDDGSGARPLDTVLLESVDIATKVSRTTIAVLEACARLTCQGPTVTVEALPRAPADGRAALARLREALADYVVAGPGPGGASPDSLTLTIPPAPDDGALEERERLTAPSTIAPLRVLAGAEVDHPHLPLEAGVVAFDYLATFETLPDVAIGDNTCPDYLFYDARIILVIDHPTARATLVGASLDEPDLAARLDELAAAIDAFDGGGGTDAGAPVAIPAGGDGDRRARVGSAPAVEGVDGGGQLVEAGGQVRLIETGAHEGGPGGGVVDDQDDARVVEEVVGAGVVAYGDVGQGLEGGEVVEGDDAGLQGQVRVVDLGAGQDAQGRDGGGGGEALALLQGAVVGGGRDGEGQRVRGRAARAGPGDDVVGQGLAQAGQGGPAVGGGPGEGLDGDGRALAGQSRAGLEDGDGGARDLGGDVDALQQDGVQRPGAGAVVGGGDETGGGEVLQKAPAVVGVADRPRQDGGRPKRHVVPSCWCHQDPPRACEEPAWWRARGSGACLRGMSGSPIGEPPPLAGAERCHSTSLGAGGGDDQIVARARVPS